jgi:hypothetical protein
MSIFNEVGKLFSPNDPELVEKTLLRLEEQDHWNDVFSTKLIELLDSHDQMKREARDSLDSLGEAKNLYVKADAGLVEALALALMASQSLEMASQRYELAIADQTRTSLLVRKGASLLITSFAAISVCVILASQFLSNTPWVRPLSVLLCVGIAAIAAASIWREIRAK